MKEEVIEVLKGYIKSKYGLTPSEDFISNQDIPNGEGSLQESKSSSFHRVLYLKTKRRLFKRVRYNLSLSYSFNSEELLMGFSSVSKTEGESDTVSPKTLEEAYDFVNTNIKKLI